MVGPARPTALCYSPDGRALVQVGDVNPTAVWDPATGRRLYSLRGHRETAIGSKSPAVQVFAAAFSRDGQWLATGGLDGTLRLWDVRHDYQQVAVLSTVSIRVEPPSAAERPLWSRGAVRSVTFSPDGSQLVAALLNNEVRVYDMKPILARMSQPAEELLAETERWTGLRLQDDRLVPVHRLRLVREGESLR
jgi:WD40 repeat protein